MNIKKHAFFILIIFTLPLTACVTLEIGIEITPTLDQAAIETAVATIIQGTNTTQQSAQATDFRAIQYTATAYATQTTAIAQSIQSTDARAIQYTATAQATQATAIAQSIQSTDARAIQYTATAQAAQSNTSSLHSGLIFHANGHIFKVGADGQAKALIPYLDPKYYLPDPFNQNAVISPDEKLMISWWDYEDLWLINLTTGKLANMTNTPDRIEYSAQFMPDHPDTIIFMSQPKQSPEMSAGYITSMKLDGSGYRVLDESVGCLGLPSPSPDGQTIAYDRAGYPWLYHWDSGPEAFLPNDYGMNGIKSDLLMGSAAWSPMGKYLAWIASGDLISDGRNLTAVLVFDLESYTHHVIHPYQAMGRSGWYKAPSWSPDEHWLAFTDESIEQPGLWLAHSDGSDEKAIYNTNIHSIGRLETFWSPSGQYLLISDLNAEDDTRLTLLNLLTNQTEPSPLPADAIPLAWAQ